jgi:hypothetical protein
MKLEPAAMGPSIGKYECCDTVAILEMKLRQEVESGDPLLCLGDIMCVTWLLFPVVSLVKMSLL